MASPLVTHAPDRPHARGAAHASTGSRAASASSAVTRPGVMDSTRMVAQRQRMAAMSGPVGTAGGGAIQRMPNPPSGGQTPGHPTPPASSQGSSSTDEDTRLRRVSRPVTGEAAVKKPSGREPSASLGNPWD